MDGLEAFLKILTMGPLLVMQGTSDAILIVDVTGNHVIVLRLVDLAHRLLFVFAPDYIGERLIEVEELGALCLVGNASLAQVMAL